VATTGGVSQSENSSGSRGASAPRSRPLPLSSNSWTAAVTRMRLGMRSRQPMAKVTRYSSPSKEALALQVTRLGRSWPRSTKP
jgi:hypothetical protein